MCLLIYAMPTGGGESAKTWSEKWAIRWQTAMSLLCSEARAMSRVITLTGCLFFPGVSQQVTSLWILSLLSYGLLPLVYLEVSPPTLFKGLIPLNKKKGSYMWWLTDLSCRHDFKQAEKKRARVIKGPRTRVKNEVCQEDKLNWSLTPSWPRNASKKRFASRHSSSVARLMTRLGQEGEERIQWVGWGGLQ